MLEKLKSDITMWWEDFVFKYGPERIELARARLSAHESAMAEGYQSPYTDPDDYDMAWRPLVKRKITKVDTETSE